MIGLFSQSNVFISFRYANWHCFQLQTTIIHNFTFMTNQKIIICGKIRMFLIEIKHFLMQQIECESESWNHFSNFFRFSFSSTCRRRDRRRRRWLRPRPTGRWSTSGGRSDRRRRCFELFRCSAGTPERPRPEMKCSKHLAIIENWRKMELKILQLHFWRKKNIKKHFLIKLFKAWLLCSIILYDQYPTHNYEI